MVQVLFTHAYLLRLDPKQWRRQQPYAPLATITAAAVVREAGFSVALHDTTFAPGPESLEPALLAHAPTYLVIYDDGFNYLTKMCLTAMREAAFGLAARGRAHGCRVIVASSDSTDHAADYLARGADFVLLGEADQTLPDLLRTLSHGDDPAHVPGLAFLAPSGGVQTTGRRAVMTDLDALPLPAWDLVDLLPYRAAWLRSTGYFSLNIATTRGCPYKCNWCAKPIYGNRYHARSPAHVVRELQLLQARVGLEHVWFCDDIFGLKPGWVESFAELVAAAGLRFRFKIQSRADLLARPGAAEALARAGCETIWLGAESGAQSILDAMDKGITVAQIYEATRRIRHLGMAPAFFLQFGYPGETKADIAATLQMLFELMPADIGVSVSYPLPGTLFYERVKAELTQKANWTDSSDLALLFRNTYPPAYYRALHRYVHQRFRQRQALTAVRELLAAPQTLTRPRLLRQAASVFYHTPAALLAHFAWRRAE